MNNVSLIQFEKTSLCPLGDGRQVIRSEFAERCYIYQSFGFIESTFGDLVIKPHVSFLADNGEGCAAEWEPQYGPIQIWVECEEGWTGKGDFDEGSKARQHWHFSFVEDRPGAWSQLAVDREGLRKKLVNGDLAGVFDVLMRWAHH